MGLLSGRTIITSLSLFHITLAYFLLTNPRTVADQTLVFVVGEAVGLPREPSFETRSAPLAFMAIILGFIGLTDLVSLSLPEDVCLIDHWGSQAPLRLLITLFLLGYTFVFGPSSPVFRENTPNGGILTHPDARTRNPGYVPSGWGGDDLKNRVFFTFMFLEMFCWFTLWITLRDERNEILIRKAKEQARRMD